VADVAVFPSLYEPFGIVALEGMAAGAAVVASDAGGLREVVLHDETGTLSFAGDPQSLAWAIVKVLRDPKRAEGMKAKARERLYAEFDWSLIADQTIEVYKRVWSEFIDSYWAETTVWPVTPGAEERADELKLRAKADAGTVVERPRPRVMVSAPPIAQKLAEEELAEAGSLTEEDDEGTG
jgi:hypothetical protein